MNQEQMEQVKNWIIKQEGLIYINEKKDSLEIVQVEKEEIMSIFFSANVKKITIALEFLEVDWFFHINYEKHLTVHVY